MRYEMEFPVLCLVLNAALVWGMCMSMSICRMSRKQGFGTSDDPGDLMTKLSRAQIVTCEYAPIICVLILYIHFQAAHSDLPISNVSYAGMVCATAGSYIFPVGLVQQRKLTHKAHPLRRIGALLRYIGMFLLTVSALVN
eukprot:Rmarinus@m.5437